jgi:hypothetical protein
MQRNKGLHRQERRRDRPHLANVDSQFRDIEIRRSKLGPLLAAAEDSTCLNSLLEEFPVGRERKHGAANG